MLLALGDHRFDVTHRALIVALVDDLDSLDELLTEGPEVLAVTSPSLAREVCDRVDVPVGVVTRDQIEFSGRPVSSVGPFPGAAPERMARVVAAIVAGDRVIVSTEVRSDRRVAEVMARILAARQPA